MVNQDLLLEGSVLFEQFNQPRDSVFINDFSKTFTSSNIQKTEEILVFGFPLLVVQSKEVSPDKRDNVESLFGSQGIKSSGVDFLTTKDDLAVSGQTFFDSVFHFETRGERMEIRREAKHLSKDKHPRIESQLEDQTSWVIFHVPFLGVTEDRVVKVQFLLRIDIFKILDQVPPSLVSLDVDCIGLFVSNYISGSLGQQG